MTAEHNAEFTDKAEALAFAVANGIREDVFASRLECGWSLDRAARQPLKAPASETRRRRPAPEVDLPPHDLMMRWERVAVQCGVRPLNFIREVKRGTPLFYAAKAWNYRGRLPRATWRPSESRSKATAKPQARKRRE